MEADELPELMARYRRDFRPHRGSAPEVIASVDALIADTDQEARDLALPEVWAMARSRTTGVFEQLEPVERIRREDWSEKETRRDRKSTRLNSSHVAISYAVFCLKKKKKIKKETNDNER